mmetsp:Transcript_1786/g.5005  ORF Transcript_1786/g.5005 Transcript_1786/m.5005 type:complete len:297 (+) Transcript_1786:85-975(+)
MPSSMAKIGLWVEGSAIDRWDKWVSYHLAFSWSLGLAELPLAVPGTWFGTTTTSLGSAPLLLALAADHANSRLVVAAVVTFIVALVVFGLVVCGMADRNLLWWKPPVVVAYSVALARWLSPDRGLQVIAFYISAWGYGVLLGTLLKTVYARRRPCVSMEGCEKISDMRLLPLHEHLCMGYTAIESFPSGDACGGGVASATLYLVTGGASMLVWLPMVLSAYGRMYIWAHHFLDVAVGAALGAGTTFALNAILPWEVFTLPMLVACVLIFFLVRKLVVIQLRPELPKDLTGGTHYYG